MAHNLEFKDGKYSFASNEPGWHGLGTILKRKMVAEEAMEISRQNYLVAKTNAMFEVDGEVFIDENRFVTYRTDTNFPLGIVGSKYHITQNYQLFDFFDHLVERDEAIYETAGVLHNGEVVFLTAKLPDYFSHKGKEMTDLYVVLTTSHDGSLSTKVMVTPIRVVCNNTLNFALERNNGKLSIKHTESAAERIKNAARVMGIVNEYTAAYNEMMDELLNTKITGTDVIQNIEKLTPSLGQNKTRIEGIRNEIYKHIYTAPGQEDIKDTAWGFVNGISHYLQTKKVSSLETRFRNIFEGNARLQLTKSMKLMQDVNTL